MHADDLSRLSVQSLRLLVAVHEARSLTAAAARFDMNQSSVSYTIDRLRDAFGDPLFVRAGRGIEPTPRCAVIVAAIGRMLADLSDLARGEDFDPARSTQRLVLSCNYHERVVLLPAILRKMRAEAPGMRLSVIQANTAAARQLRGGVCDIAISPEGADQPGILRRRLFAERYRLFVDPAHPFARKAPTLADYLAADHVVVRYGEGWRPYHHTYLEGLGHRLRPALEVPSLGGIEALLPGTALVLTAPGLMRRVFAPRLACVAAPFDVRFDEHLLWTERTDGSAAHRWLRDLIVAAAAEVQTD